MNVLRQRVYTLIAETLVGHADDAFELAWFTGHEGALGHGTNRHLLDSNALALIIDLAESDVVRNKVSYDFTRAKLRLALHVHILSRNRHRTIVEMADQFGVLVERHVDAALFLNLSQLCSCGPITYALVEPVSKVAMMG